MAVRRWLRVWMEHPLVLEVGEELEHPLGREVAHGQTIRRLSQFAGDERHQHFEGVPVAFLGVAGQIALGHHVFEKITFEPASVYDARVRPGGP